MVLNKVKVFVYGTLKSGEPNHFFMKELGCKLIANAVTVGKYPLLVTTKSNLPFLLNLKGTGHNIEGELYEIDEKFLADLDDFELCPGVYSREVIQVATINEKETVECFSYLLPDFPPHFLTKPLISSYSNATTTAKYSPRGDVLTVQSMLDFIKADTEKYMENNDRA